MASSSTPRATTIYAPHPFPSPRGTSIFLAGSIDQGTAIEWQVWLSGELEKAWARDNSSKTSSGQDDGSDPAGKLTVLNPRRTDWDSSWKEEMGEQPFTEQVEWELDMQEAATVIAVYFGVKSAAPISLLELGLSARSGKVVVCCPSGFYRRGNVQIVCARFGIQCVETLEELRDAVLSKLNVAAK